ncbi:hypothetical protein QYF36_013681 [Acer negundo]|nr:hypothetical protein QYF36_013681 [Acer negundo]
MRIGDEVRNEGGMIMAAGVSKVGGDYFKSGSYMLGFPYSHLFTDEKKGRDVSVVVKDGDAVPLLSFCQVVKGVAGYVGGAGRFQIVEKVLHQTSSNGTKDFRKGAIDVMFVVQIMESLGKGVVVKRLRKLALEIRKGQGCYVDSEWYISSLAVEVERVVASFQSVRGDCSKGGMGGGSVESY